MEELEAVGAVAVSLKPVIDLAKSLMDALGSGKGREQAVKLYGEILAAQERALAANAAQATLIEEKRHMEKRLADLETWDREKQRYELVELSHGVFARRLKTQCACGEPIHPLCADCYSRGVPSILQSDGLPGIYGGPEKLTCSTCRAVIEIQHPDRGGSRSLGYGDNFT